MASQEDIATFQAFTGCDDVEVARRFLQHFGSVDVAAPNYLDNPNQFNFVPDTWNDDYFVADRAGGLDNNAFQGGGAFNIHAIGDEAQAFSSNVPTGAPSRVNTPQEEGYTAAHSTGSYFGPARQQNYDPSQWALTQTAVTEVWSDVLPNERDREENAPAFIKPLGNADLLPPLLTILGACDEIRHALSAHTRVAFPNYGWHKDWWTGTLIKLAIPIDETGDREAQIAHNARQEFMMEVQRLMVALEDSSRYYVSAEPMTKTVQWSERQFSHPIFTSVAHFAQAWTDAVSGLTDYPPAASMFCTRIGQQAADAAQPDLDYSYDFDFQIPKAGATVTLYDVIDEVIWASVDGDGLSTTRYFIDEAATVLVFRVKQPNSAKRGLDLDVPIQLHLDRYMRKNEHIMKQMRAKIAAHGPKLDAIKKAKQKLQTFSYNEFSGSSSELFENAISMLESDRNDRQTQEGEDVAMDTGSENDADAQLIAGLRALQVSVDARLAALTTQQQQIWDDIEKMKNSFKGEMAANTATDYYPEEEYNYELRGASTSDNKIYLLRRDEKAASLDASQWWHIRYHSKPSIDCYRVSQDDVLRAIKEDSRTAMLVYVKTKFINAASKAMPGALLKPDHAGTWPKPLKDFLDQDNEAFIRERTDYSTQVSDTTSGLDVTSAGDSASRRTPFGELDDSGPFVPEPQGPQMIEGIEPPKEKWKNEW